MKVPFSWLKEFVDIDVTAQELEEKLFSCGFEVEELIPLDAGISKVVVGKIVEMEKQEGTHLTKCVVDCGAYGHEIRISTGRPAAAGNCAAQPCGSGAGRRGKICAAAVRRGAAGQRRSTADRTGTLLRRERLSAAGNAAASTAPAAGESAAAAVLFARKTAGIPAARGLERESRAVKSRF